VLSDTQAATDAVDSNSLAALPNGRDDCGPSPTLIPYGNLQLQPYPFLDARFEIASHAT